jgi:hypothetical protein
LSQIERLIKFILAIDEKISDPDSDKEKIQELKTELLEFRDKTL